MASIQARPAAKPTAEHRQAKPIRSQVNQSPERTALCHNDACAAGAPLLPAACFIEKAMAPAVPSVKGLVPRLSWRTDIHIRLRRRFFPKAVYRDLKTMPHPAGPGVVPTIGT
ncbi:MAG: hypothetical protein Tsb0019_11950 [Roseibium sp.]